VLVAVIYGLNYVFIKDLLDQVPTTRAWVFIRIATATLLILPIVWLARRPLPPRDTWWWLLLAAILGVVCNQVLFAEGLQRTTPGHSAVINSAIPVLTLCFAVLAHQEQFTIRKVAAIGVALSGVFILLAERLTVAGPSLQGSLVGDLLTLGNATSFSIFLVLMRKLGRRVDPLMTTAVCFLFGTVIIGAYGAPALDAANVQALLSPTVLPLALFGILACTVLVYFLNNWALHHTHSSQVALYIYLQPVVATGLSMHLGWDDPSPRFYLATALVFSGLLLQSFGERRPADIP